MSLFSGRITLATRRWVEVRTEGVTRRARVSTKAMDVVVGDIASGEVRGDDVLITQIEPRVNSLSRVVHRKEKRMVANVDCLFIVTAAIPPPNTIAIDRVFTLARLEEIPCQILCNKSDLGVSLLDPLLDAYEHIGVPVHTTSALTGKGIEEFRSELMRPSWRVVVFCGVSGVGKSSVLNMLIPEAARPTQEVSNRTFQGKQTTSLAVGYPMERPGMEELIVVDLPGNQKFGVGHLARSEILAGFPEILAIAERCPFRDCSHLNEEDCAVRHAFEEGDIFPSRFASYVDMMQEMLTTDKYA